LPECGVYLIGYGLPELEGYGPPRSSRLNMNITEAAAITPGVERGRVTVLKSVNPLLPRFMACSSTEGSWESMEALIFI